jgi:hypothetical protein
MSQENVEIVRGLAPPSGTDLTRLFADDAGASDRLAAISPMFDAAFEFESHATGGDLGRGNGLEELAAAWREWMSPFDSWWTEIEDFVDVDNDRVLVLLRDHVRPRGGESEIESLGCNLWTLRDGKVVRIDFYPVRSEGLKAAGLSE